MWRRWLLFSAASLFPQAGHAETPKFGLPIECLLGETCYIQKYVDTLPAENRMADYACGTLASDGHKGTDFALLDLAQLERGVAVLAAADGVVRGVRDGMDDRIITAQTRDAIRGRECGNGLVIEHGGGWVTQYCHLKRGSVRVARGQTVRQGETLGQVGLSGSTEFPHLHFSVRHREKPVDPFDPEDSATCRAAEATLWEDTPDYVAGGLLSVGFSDRVPEFGAIKKGSAHSPSLKDDAGAIVFWAYMFGAKPGDTVSLVISGPDGFSFRHEAEFDKAQALAFRAAGKRRIDNEWPKGVFRGVATLKRKGQKLSEKSIVLQLSD